MKNSPKGDYRLAWFAISGLLFLIIVAISGGFDNYGQWHPEQALNPSGWVFKQFNNIAEICIGLFLLYISHRVINHKRTHEFMNDKRDTLVVTCVWILAIAFIIGHGLR